MKVVLIAPTPPPIGGISSWTQRMLDTKLLRDWEIEVVDSKIIGKRSVFSKEKKNIFIEVKRLFLIWKNLFEKVKDNDVKVIHSCIPASKNSMFREIICLMISKRKSKKFIIHYRCTVSNMVNDKLSLYLFNILNKYSDGIIVLNQESKVFIDEQYENKIRLIPNFIDEAFISKKEKKINEKIQTALYVGGVTEEKGSINIINAAKKLPDIEFKFIGSINENIEKITMPSNVLLLGEKNKSIIKKELNNADVFIFPSYFIGEGFSNSLVEAMAMGVPCIVSDWAANKDMIEDKGGIVIPAKDEQALIKALNHLRNDKISREEMSKWNLKKVKREYIDKTIINEYLNMYNDLNRGENYEI